jgi:hypothetical protein
MPKLKLLILDANVVIALHDLSLWAQVIERCDVHLSRTVIAESQFYDDKSGYGAPIELAGDERADRIKAFDLEASALRDFERLFDRNYAADLDAGEKESLAHLVRSGEEFRICSGDKIVYKILGNLNLGECGISLEEVLVAVGLTRGHLPHRDTKDFREKYTSMGEQDAVCGRGRRPE